MKDQSTEKLQHFSSALRNRGCIRQGQLSFWYVEEQCSRYTDALLLVSMVERIKHSKVWLHFTRVSADNAHCHSNKWQKYEQSGNYKSILQCKGSQIQIFRDGNVLIVFLILISIKWYPVCTHEYIGFACYIYTPSSWKVLSKCDMCIGRAGLWKGMKATDLLYYMSEARKNMSITRQHLCSATNIRKIQTFNLQSKQISKRSLLRW